MFPTLWTGISFPWQMINSLRFTICVKRLQPCPAVTRDDKKEYTSALPDTHTHTFSLSFSGKKISICTKKQTNKPKKQPNNKRPPPHHKTSRRVFLKRKINKDESHAQQQPFPAWPGEFSASDQALPSGVTWGTFHSHIKPLPPLATSHTAHAATCRNTAVFLPSVLRVGGGSEYLRRSGSGGRQTQASALSCVPRRPAGYGFSRDPISVLHYIWQGKPFKLHTLVSRSKSLYQEWRLAPFSPGWKEKCAEGKLARAGGGRRQPADARLRPSLNQPSHPLFW